MHIVYKLVALSVVFGLVLTEPSYDDNEFLDEADVTEDMDINENKTVDLVLPGLEILPVIFGMIAKVAGVAGVAGLKAKAIALGVKLIKCLAPKAIFFVIGAIATFGFCKISNLCSVAYDPVVYEMVPPQVRSMVTPERLEDAQQWLMSAIQEYNKQHMDS